MKSLASTRWGSDRNVLLHLYRTLVRSQLDYGCIVYGSGNKQALNSLNSIHHQGIRLATGAFKTSPVESLYIESHEPSLENRRKKLALQYSSKVKPDIHNPANQDIFTILYEESFQSKPSLTKPLGLTLGTPSRISFKLFCSFKR